MDLSTRYLGFDLPHPFMPGASPLVDDLDTVRELEDAGASAIVMRSLFENQITRGRVATFKHTETHAQSLADATSYFPAADSAELGPDGYLEQLRRIKEAVGVPVMASLNGASPGDWLDYARLIEQAGADALELNLYYVATNPEMDGASIEALGVEMVRSVKARLSIPVAVKLSPFYTSLAQFARRLDEAGADGLVLFNRFYQPDIDLHELKLTRELRLSTPAELPLRLRWLAILSAQVEASLAATGGVHTALDAIKAVMAGAHAVQIVSALLQKGPGALTTLRSKVAEWLEEHEYESLAQMQGSMNLMLLLQRWEGVAGPQH